MLYGGMNVVNDILLYLIFNVYFSTSKYFQTYIIKMKE
ncbi:hypothetical protein ACP1_0002 [Aeromonas phage ACP1]